MVKAPKAKVGASPLKSLNSDHKKTKNGAFKFGRKGSEG